MRLPKGLRENQQTQHEKPSLLGITWPGLKKNPRLHEAEKNQLSDFGEGVRPKLRTSTKFPTKDDQPSGG